MYILSIDPSLSNTAFVVSKLEKDGTLLPIYHRISQTKKSNDKKIPVMEDRLNRCTQHLEVLREIGGNFSISFTIGELPSGSQSSSGAVSVGSSLMFLAAARVEYNLISVTPTEVKKQVNGTSSAEKKEVIEYVDKRYANFLPRKSNGDIHLGMAEHIADAVVIAEVGIKKIIV